MVRSVIDRPAAAPTVLVVDDEPYILDLLTSALRMNGFEVRTAVDGRSALAAAAHGLDVVVLDVMLPDMDGFAVARRLRDSGNNVPVLFLTARDAVQDRIAGLNAGGDDYVSKPFSLEEVILRLRGILRRTKGSDVEPADVLRYADVVLDVGAHTVHRAGTPIVLSATEFSLLRYLLVNAGTVVSKAQILDRVWGTATEARSDRAVESFISQVRRKLDADRPPLIHTVRGVGYTLRAPDESR
ncbi:response regulator transcription factor [Nocardia yamanashiensis]|uniref:response regulator transcription factor n=1 Tax=Nocardia yamanashiensis TaxID=209247 RepID=UPI00082D6A78|nr:response regulator transcription factor [Nocardia yamanashiensis]